MQLQLSPAHPDFGKVGFAELEDRVRRRAYQLYGQRAYTHGHALDDWLEAKAEVLGVTRGDTYLANLSQGASNRSIRVSEFRREKSMRVPTKTPLPAGKTKAEAVAEQIRCRAYELYEERGREDGHAVDDWLRAETEIIGRPARAAA